MKRPYRRPMKLDHAPLPELTELQIETAELWEAIGTITRTEHGEENTYYEDQFGNRFFCKNYPQEDLS